MSVLSNFLLILFNKWAQWAFCAICAHFAQWINILSILCFDVFVFNRLIVFSISNQKFELDSIFLICLNYKLIVLSLVLHNFMKSISKSISWRLEMISLVLNVFDTRAIYELLYI